MISIIDIKLFSDFFNINVLWTDEQILFFGRNYQINYFCVKKIKNPLFLWILLYLDILLKEIKLLDAISST
jgi:hypothetical protein